MVHVRLQWCQKFLSSKCRLFVYCSIHNIVTLFFSVSSRLVNSNYWPAMFTRHIFYVLWTCKMIVNLTNFFLHSVFTLHLELLAAVDGACTTIHKPTLCNLSDYRWLHCNIITVNIFLLWFLKNALQGKHCMTPIGLVLGHKYNKDYICRLKHN